MHFKTIASQRERVCWILVDVCAVLSFLTRIFTTAHAGLLALFAKTVFVPSSPGSTPSSNATLMLLGCGVCGAFRKSVFDTQSQITMILTRQWEAKMWWDPGTINSECAASIGMINSMSYQDNLHSLLFNFKLPYQKTDCVLYSKLSPKKPPKRSSRILHYTWRE